MIDTFAARVVGAFGRHIEVRDGDGTRHAARPFGRKLSLVCGDRVRCERDAQSGEWHAVEVLTRTNALLRSNARGGAEAVVANIDLLAIVLAARPEPDPFMIDRYLAAAASCRIAALLVVNKSDLPTSANIEAQLGNWQQLGYPVLHCAARTAAGIDALTQQLAGRTAVLVGQSGVGKSSLLTQLVPQAQAATGELMRDDEGRHTTTASQMYELPGGGELIDSPGVRDFAPAISSLEPRSLGFVEIDRYGVSCRFQDCQHMREPHCAVTAAVASGSISPRRYESYRRLRRLFTDLTQKQPRN